MLGLLTVSSTMSLALRNLPLHQVEFYFSKQNLQTDGFLVSKMNAQMCVPVAVIAQFHKIQHLTSDTALIAESVKDSTVCAVTPDGIKPSIKQERNTIILREIPSETPQDKVCSASMQACLCRTYRTLTPNPTPKPGPYCMWLLGCFGEALVLLKHAVNIATKFLLALI